MASIFYTQVRNPRFLGREAASPIYFFSSHATS